MLLKLLQKIQGFLRILLLAALIGGASMLISFFVVNHLARELVAGKTVSPSTIRKANTLRVFSNELVNICNEYVRRLAADSGAAPVNVLPWVEKVFRPEIQFLQQRMDESFREDSSLSAELEAAAARCGAMARYPTDVQIRVRTLQEVATTVGKVDAWIDREGIDPRLSSPAVARRFP